MKQFKILFVVISVFCAGCKSTPSQLPINFNTLGEKYVRLGLKIGLYDPDFVDAYYGPDSLKPASAKGNVFPKDSLLAAVNALREEIKLAAEADSTNDTTALRAAWMDKQLLAFSRRIKIFSGELKSFDEESADLFSVTAPSYDEKHFQEIISRLNSILPGKGTIIGRTDALAKKFIIPKDKVDTVFKTAIEEARKRTHAHYQLPANETFVLEYVNNKPWSGYNWYQGNYKSVIQMNLDLPIFIDRAIDLACHEGYPGHHVYNMLLEKNLYHDKGWVEISLYPLFSPQSLIAEGSANYGIDLAFPGNDKVRFAKEVLLPLAGMDTAHIDAYLELIHLKTQLNYVRNEVARKMFSGAMTDEEALRWLTNYGLFSKESAAKSISFIRKYRTYVICYNYGLDLVKSYVESGAAITDPAKRWDVFGWLLSNPVNPLDLSKKK